MTTDYEQIQLFKHGSLNQIKNLLNSGVDINKIYPNNYSPLDLAIMMNNKKVIGFLLENGAINGNAMPQTTPLHFAIEYGYNNGNYYEIIEYLIDNFVSVNTRDYFGNTPLHLVYDDIKLAKLLVEKGANVFAENNNGNIPYEYATATGKAKQYLYFLTYGQSKKAGFLAYGR